MSKGLTLAEMLIVIGMLIVLVGMVMYIFHVILFSWVSEEARAGLGIELDRAVNMIAKDVREAAESTPQAIKWRYPQEIRFAVVADSDRYPDGTPKPNFFHYYIYYFYNANDRYPNAFTQSAYDLKRYQFTNVTGNDPNTGTFTYGAGQIVANQVLPPIATTAIPKPGLSVNGDTVTIDLSITRDSETMRVQTDAIPRNIQ